MNMTMRTTSAVISAMLSRNWPQLWTTVRPFKLFLLIMLVTVEKVIMPTNDSVDIWTTGMCFLCRHMCYTTLSAFRLDVPVVLIRLGLTLSSVPLIRWVQNGMAVFMTGMTTVLALTEALMTICAMLISRVTRTTNGTDCMTPMTPLRTPQMTMPRASLLCSASNSSRLSIRLTVHLTIVLMTITHRALQAVL